MRNNSFTFANEPVAIITAVIAFVSAIIALLPLFGVPLTAEQTSGIMAVVIALGGVLSTVLIRQQVTPVSNPYNNEGEKLTPELPNVP